MDSERKKKWAKKLTMREEKMQLIGEFGTTHGIFGRVFCEKKGGEKEKRPTEIPGANRSVGGLLFVGHTLLSTFELFLFVHFWHCLESKLGNLSVHNSLPNCPFSLSKAFLWPNLLSLQLDFPKYNLSQQNPSFFLPFFCCLSNAFLFPQINRRNSFEKGKN